MPIDEDLEGLRRRWRQVQDQNLSEIDTQILLIEPVLKMAGWDLLD